MHVGSTIYSYKVFQETYLRKQLDDQALCQDENEDFVFNFNQKFKEAINLYSDDNSQFKNNLTDLLNSINERKIPFNQDLLWILDYLIEKYTRSHQDDYFGKTSLKILYNFAKSDTRYCEILVELGFLQISQKSLKIGFPGFFKFEICTLNCIISHKETQNNFHNYGLDDIISHLLKINDIDACNVVFLFFSHFLQLENINENSVLKIMMLFIKIKEINSYCSIDTRHWSKILFDSIKTNYFKPELFFQGALYDFYQQNYKHPFHIPYICQFYSIFILRYPNFMHLLSFDFQGYFQLLNKQNFDQFGNDKEYIKLLIEENMFDFENAERAIIHWNSLHEELKSCIYNTLAYFLYALCKYQQDRDSFMKNIPEDFQIEIIRQISVDIENSNFLGKSNLLFFLSTYANIRPDIILKQYNIVEYIELYSEFLEVFYKSDVLDIFLCSISSFETYIHQKPNYKKLIYEIAQTETLRNLRNLVYNIDLYQESKELTFKHIQQILNMFYKNS